MADDESGSDEEEHPPAAPGALLQTILAATGSDDESEDDNDDTPAAHNSEPAKAVDADAEPAPGSSSGLPSAMDMLFGSEAKPDFLRVEGPEFDASKNFKPPAVTHADLMPVAGEHRFVRRSLDDEAPAQRYHPEENFGRGAGQTRLRGSVCHETDAERGRRVVYGAHNMLKADPWSQCNPNFAFRSGASGKKRPRGE